MASIAVADTANSEQTSSASAVKTKMTIIMKHDKQIIQTPRRMSVAQNEKLKVIVDDLLKKGHIRPSTSPYASAAMLMDGKKKGEYRLLVDYRKVNEAMVRETFPPRDVNGYCRQLSYNRLYSRYRLKKDYHLVKMAEDSIKYTSFVTICGQFEFLVMPYGLANASCFFLKFLNEVFRPMTNRKSIVLHLEDIFIATKDQDKHLDIMDEMNETITRHGLRIKGKKSYGMEDEIKFMGFVINKYGAQYCGFIGSDDDDEEGDSSDDDDNF